ncbi:NAD(P)H-binding protein [Pedobacter sp. Du54]|uniref:NAD(P)H-binding protein n=1 Tax=Pedobacter anseongensis TaxID=3133439 RepID=UPI0030A893BE
MKKETVSILGCGWYGLALAKSLVAEGYAVKGSTTSENKLALLKAHGIAPYLVNIANEKDVFDSSFFTSDVLVICIPSRRREEGKLSPIDQIKTICTLTKSKQIIFISSTGIYQDGNFSVDENTIPEPTSEVGKFLLAAETLLRQNMTFTTTIIRFGGLIGPNRDLAKHFAGKKAIANGLAPINLIHLEDCIGLTKAILQQQAFGLIYHGVAPTHPTRADFYTRACITSGFEKPEFVNELLDWKKIESVNVPKVYAMVNLLTFL